MIVRALALFELLGVAAAMGLVCGLLALIMSTVREPTNKVGCTRISPAGFTLIELLVVIVIMVTLMGLGVGIYGKILASSKVSATRSIVNQVASAISNYNADMKSWFDPTAAVVKIITPMWDLDHDGILDGPTANSGSFPVDYSGFLAMTGANIPQQYAVNGSVRDAWAKPLYVQYPSLENNTVTSLASRPSPYLLSSSAIWDSRPLTGNSWLGIFSSGPDKKSSHDNVVLVTEDADNVRSWE